MANFDKTKVFQFINKWMPLLEKVEKDESLKNRCKKFNAYIPSKEGDALIEELQFSSFLEEAYDSGIVVQDYWSFTESKEELVIHPTDVFVKSLSLDNLLRCIAYHFRNDHFSNGSLVCESIADGSLLKFLKAAKEKLI